MKKYRFRLEQALSIRRLQASLERVNFEQAMGEARRIESERRLLTESSEAARIEARTGMVRGIELSGLEGFLDCNARAERECVKRLREAAARLQLLRTRLMAAERKVAVLEKLEERARRKWKREFDLEQERLAGEAFLARWKPSDKR